MASSSDQSPLLQGMKVLPSALIATIMTKLDIRSIQSLPSTCKTFRSCAAHILSFVSTFHLFFISCSGHICFICFNSQICLWDINATPRNKTLDAMQIFKIHEGIVEDVAWHLRQEYLLSLPNLFLEQLQRRPKSKSGPLGPPGIAYYQLFSPAAPTIGGNAGKLVTTSPFSTGMMATDGLSIQYGGSGNFPIGTEPCMARSIIIHGSLVEALLKCLGSMSVQLENCI
ncbi:unnamed protein product [Fraxinus pennsylvanica]|uniref:F-box domain-containing protein n=1 Tax=Fraxinus pennsylvanica TaxID=56036 RepID=A0AAD1ZUE4_9LAMI|nr:unnamed protein product [Fraxinus pennsylvanica]